jgi:hypothetical protein
MTMAQKKSDQPEALAESSPNPHSEQHIAHDVVKTDTSHTTGQRNVAQTPNTKEGRLHPSIAEVAEGVAFDDDSMFNSADPQIRPGKRSPSTDGKRKSARRLQ